MSDPRLPPPRRAPAPFPSWAVALALVPPGCLFILRAHRWHLTPSVIVLCLCWAGVVATGYALARLAMAVFDPVADDWFAVGGSRDDLEREKKSLLRAIKEVEFDRDTGKITPADAAALIHVYRHRAIEVIKTLELGGALTPRERILAELKARAAVDRRPAKAKKKGEKPKAAQKAAEKTEAAVDKAEAAASTLAPATDPDTGSDSDTGSGSDTDTGTDSGSGSDSGSGTGSGMDSGPDADSAPVTASAPDPAPSTEERAS